MRPHETSFNRYATRALSGACGEAPPGGAKPRLSRRCLWPRPLALKALFDAGRLQDGIAGERAPERASDAAERQTLQKINRMSCITNSQTDHMTYAIGNVTSAIAHLTCDVWHASTHVRLVSIGKHVPFIAIGRSHAACRMFICSYVAMLTCRMLTCRMFYAHAP